MFVRVYVYVNVCMCVCVYVCTCVPVCVRVYARVRMRVSMYMSSRRRCLLVPVSLSRETAQIIKVCLFQQILLIYKSPLYYILLFE